ncbi:hypothetical protein AVDCRST_MAG94-2701 [uncultured Leptolyngbya sp.]|uniref:Uncharacterized protein n=1 Tax=uncultured Leptolyngbya sp. TaxID=332963 RepID=A0A6J4M547_9CYAN|nr:hypothetical protein AVDCRST_MAG94-2701 [uncultured Leptolyngbya sp.]
MNRRSTTNSCLPSDRASALLLAFNCVTVQHICQVAIVNEATMARLR